MNQIQAMWLHTSCFIVKKKKKVCQENKSACCDIMHLILEHENYSTFISFTKLTFCTLVTPHVNSKMKRKILTEL